WNDFGLYRKDRDGEVHWVKVLGGSTRTLARHGGGVLEESPVTPRRDWLDADPTDEDPLRIVAFKAKAWEIGGRARDEHGWCSTYDSVMRTVDVDADSARSLVFEGMRVGDVVSADQARRLPLGSVLSYLAGATSDEHLERWAYFIRTDQRTNAAGTRRLASYAADPTNPVEGHYARSMRVVHINFAGSGEEGEGEKDYTGRLFDRRQMYPLPIGTVVRHGEGGRTLFTKHRDGRWGEGETVKTTPRQSTVIDAGRYGWRDFGSTLCYV